MDTSITSGISMLLASYFKINPANIFVLQPLITQTVSLVHNFEFDMLDGFNEFMASVPTYTYTIILLVMLFCYLGRNKIVWWYNRVYDYFDNTTTFQIYDARRINSILDELITIKSVNKSDLNIGTNVLLKRNNDGYFLNEYPTKFTYFKFEINDNFVDGYVMVSFVDTKEIAKTKDKEENVINVKQPLLTIRLNKKMSYNKFIKMVDKKYDEKCSDNRKKNIRIYCDTYKGNNLAFGVSSMLYEVKTINHNPTKFINNYFHYNKAFINNLTNIKRINLLLHGPNGCGKSKLINILAKIMQRHVIIINIINMKLDNLVSAMTGKINGNKEGGKKIIVIENIDEVINYLLIKENNINRNIQTLLTNKKNTVNITEYYKTMDDKITINELMNLLLPINPPSNRWVIATTNNYEEIKSKVPQLFTPGRLTPFEFKYVDQDVFNQITNKYYNVTNIIIIPTNHTVPTSQIIECAKLYRQNVNGFRQEMIKIFDKNQEDIAEKITLYGSKVMIDKNEINEIVTTFYETYRNKYNKQDIINEYFSNDIDNILNYINNLDSFNLILHGPPGTGKSKLIEVIAKVKERHLLSICLKNHNKYETNNFLSCPTINGKTYNPNEVIIVLEEFDQTFFDLIKKEEALSKANTTQEAFIKCRDELYMGDLLEIFQSSIPRPGQIIIATSNHYEEMKDIKPALFRPGRLTPILINYINQQTFDTLVKHYFNVPNTIVLPDNHKIPTSQLTEFALLSNGDYSVFKHNITKVIDTTCHS